jgi:hypothetical protein
MFSCLQLDVEQRGQLSAAVANLLKGGLIGINGSPPFNNMVMVK